MKTLSALGSAMETKIPYEDVEKLANARQNALNRIKTFGMLTSVCGICCIPLGIVLIVYIDFSEASFPVNSCIQIWAGFYMMTLGGIAIYTSGIQVDLRSDIPYELKRWLRTVDGMCSGGYSIGGMFVGWSLAAAIVCGVTICGNNRGVIVGVSSAATVLSCLCLVGAIFIHRAIYCNRGMFQIPYRCCGRGSNC